MVKQRENGRVVGVKTKTIYGEDEREVLELLGQSTSYVERTNLTSRHMNGRLVRKTLGYSKELGMLRGCADRLATFHICQFSERSNRLLINH